MEIKKCSDFINEATINKVLDKVIDTDGNLINIKGYILSGEKKIKDIDDNEYVAGIDKNGKLFSYLDTDDDNNLVYDDKLLGWNLDDNYLNKLSTLPTGWVNVKVDMEVIKKVKRFATAILNDHTDTGFDKKLRFLSDPSTLRETLPLRRGDQFLITQSIQRQMAAIMLLRYLLEIKDHFNPSQAGFLFESFLGGLLPGRVPDDNSECDIMGDNGMKYQVKFLQWDYSGKNYSIPFKPDCDEYLYALKKHNQIYIWRLTSYDGTNCINPLVTSSGVSTSKMKKLQPVAILDLSKIDNSITEISNELKGVVTNLWEEISKLQYNIETIITGVDKEHNTIDRNQYNKSYRDATNNINNLSDQLSNLKKEMKHE